MEDFTKEKLAALSIADIKSIREYALKNLQLDPGNEYWFTVSQATEEEWYSRITNIFGPIE